MMDTPTRVQRRILRAIQNKTVSTGRRVERMRLQRQLTGQEPHPAWYEQFFARSMVRQLEDAALAGGVPAAWIEHVIERGQRGVRWDPDRYLRQPEPINRGRILQELSQDSQRIRDMAAINAIYGELGRAAEAGTATGFDRNLRNLWRRTVAVTQVLDITEPEASQLWQTDEWVPTAAADIGAAARRGELERLWRSGARADTTAYKLQADALRRIGLTPEHAQHPPPTPQQITDRIREALAVETAPEPTDPAIKDPGIEIAAAIDAVTPALDRTRAIDPDSIPWEQDNGMPNCSGMDP
ncbi:hypothetical protein ABIA39_007525 [Nocardia sp. GAS34]|uniref:hypothetical protein n=1 Tax=unclassified Nocardia TaxID=2637762 RepID=UPI003D1DF61F